MANLFKSIANSFRAAKNEIAEALADPVRDGKIAIEDSKKEIDKFTDGIAQLIAETKKLEREKVLAESEVTKFHAIAEKAAIAGNTDDARRALEHKKAATQRVSTLGSEATRNAELTDSLKTQLATSKKRLEKAQSDLSCLTARQQAATIRKDFAEAGTKFDSDSSALAALDDLEKAVVNLETEAEAYEELKAEQAGQASEALESKYTVEDEEIEKELADLLKKNK